MLTSPTILKTQQTRKKTHSKKIMTAAAATTTKATNKKKKKNNNANELTMMKLHTSFQSDNAAESLSIISI